MRQQGERECPSPPADAVDWGAGLLARPPPSDQLRPQAAFSARYPAAQTPGTAFGTAMSDFQTVSGHNGHPATSFENPIYHRETMGRKRVILTAYSKKKTPINYRSLPTRKAIHSHQLVFFPPFECRIAQLPRLLAGVVYGLLFRTVGGKRK